MILALLWLAAGQSADKLQSQGVAAFQAGNLAAALESFQAVVRADPKRADGWRLLGAALAAQERFAQAGEPFEKACALQPKDPLNCYYLGRNHYALSRLEAAVEAFERALKASGPKWRVHQGLALALEGLGRLDDAERHFRDARKQAPEDAGTNDPRVEYGAFLTRDARAAEAIPMLQQATRANPSYGRAFFELGTALSEADRYDEARTALEKAVSLEPRHWPSHLLLSKMLFRLGRAEEGRRHAEIGRQGIAAQGSATVR